jgi:hypothetical protein
MTVTYGHGNKPWVSIQSRKFLDKLRKNRFLKKNSFWSYLGSHLVLSKINTPLHACNIQSSTIVFLIRRFINHNKIIYCFLLYLIRVQQKKRHNNNNKFCICTQNCSVNCWYPCPLKTAHYNEYFHQNNAMIFKHSHFEMSFHFVSPVIV